jgi:hypothetical protein
MNNRGLKAFGIAALVAQCVVAAACSSANSGSSGAGGSITGGQGGAVAGGGSTGNIPDPNNPGSCIVGTANNDFLPGGACASDCASVSCGKACHADCCVTCGIDQTGAKTCTCPNPGNPYDNCACLPPSFIPPGLLGGPCMPQGYSTVTVPATAPAGSISLRDMPCRMTNLVCFTADSTGSSERGCICEADGLMHCGSVNHWFTNNFAQTAWQ